jgi:hypothetical protein
MAYEALRDYADRSIECRFVSNIDPTDVYEKVLAHAPVCSRGSSRCRLWPVSVRVKQFPYAIPL